MTWEWNIYQGTGDGEQYGNRICNLPDPPPWRRFEEREDRIATTYKASTKEVELVNAALYLRRPLLIRGNPGSGKTSLAYAVAHELDLGKVLRWSITTRSTLEQGLYEYDAIGRLQEANLNTLRQKGNGGEEQHSLGITEDDIPDIGAYMRLGPLGTAFVPSDRPRVLLIDEIDKCDIDLPNNLLHIFEEGQFVIPELKRQKQTEIDVPQWDDDTPVCITRGRICCTAFPLVIMTSNDERDFPPAFLRRCLQLDMPDPDRQKLRDIAKSHLGEEILSVIEPMLQEFLDRQDSQKGVGSQLATDQLLNALYLVKHDTNPLLKEKKDLLDAVLRSLAG